ncbi:MAG TPA: GGDEF domain-containing protein [Thermoanaerobaculia bacterium]|nr:GGDEF domain-containing protein [Thermoanaerobaculia bacterium]
MRRLIGITASAAVVIAIGWVDYITGPEIGLSLLYLVPIAVSAWYGGVTPAIFVASAAAAVWLAADLAWRSSDASIAIPLWNAFTRLVIYNSEGVFIALLHRDREMLRRLVAREAALARTDHATSLPNMRAFLEAADAELRHARSSGEALCVIYIDLDNFKKFNDGLGHAAGDELLLEAGRILKEADGIAARLGGDEFAVLLRGVGEAQARETAERIIARIRALGAVYADIGFGATAGVAYFRTPPSNADDLIRAADDAMYEGKARGKGRVVFQNV